MGSSLLSCVVSSLYPPWSSFCCVLTYRLGVLSCLPSFVSCGSCSCSGLVLCSVSFSCLVLSVVIHTCLALSYLLSVAVVFTHEVASFVFCHTLGWVLSFLLCLLRLFVLFGLSFVLPCVFPLYLGFCHVLALAWLLSFIVSCPVLSLGFSSLALSVVFSFVFTLALACPLYCLWHSLMK